ncbi:MAG: alpha/beta hydrolase, partial [Atribacterota bacterium]
MPAYDRDPTDADESEKPEYIFYLRINQVGTRVFGQLSRVTSSGFLEGSLSGQRKEATIEFVAKFKDESITFTGSWLNDRRGWVGKWVSDQGDSGEAIFLSKTVDLNQIKGIFGNKNELIFKGGNGQPVIFVHGIMSDGSRWDKSLEQLQAHNYFEDHQVWVFQYNWRDPIVLNGEDFLKRLNEAGIHDPVIVAHSMGGLVSRSCIAQGGEIERLITLGTPHNGTPLANFGALLLGSSNFGEWVQNVLFPGLSDMKETSSFIADLNSNQRDIQQREKYVVFSGGMSCYIVARNVCLENGCDQRA